MIGRSIRVVRVGSFVAALAALAGCGGSDLECAHVMLEGDLPVQALGVDVAALAPSVELGGVTFGWSATVDDEILVSLRASPGVTFTDDELTARRIAVHPGCSELAIGSGVVGAGFGLTVQVGDPVVAVVRGCDGDCDLRIDFPEPTTDG